MAKPNLRYVCQACGSAFGKWTGRCESCGEWNTIVEEAQREAAPGGLGRSAKAKARTLDFASLSGPAEQAIRRPSGILEFDRVCGGGLVDGSAVLVGGDPGIGKSTVLLQVVARLATAGLRTVYISGEEAVDQVRLRAARLDVEKAEVEIAAATSVRDIVAALERSGAPRSEVPRVVVIDSIQTMFLDSLDSAPGTVSQVRGSAQELIRLAKRLGFALLLVGHVTKEGVIAGPKVLEHMVDTVLTFEGDRGHQFRILRAAKNRFGPTDEIGVFEMTDAGMVEVPNPSLLFLADRDEPVSGAAVFAGLEGSRPVLCEIQALVAPSPLATPRRAVVGWDSARLAMVLAVLETRCGLVLAGRDVYLNVAGGLRISEPAADLAVAAALVSAASDRPIPAGIVVFGEIGLSGEVRAVNRDDLRLKEAAKLGFHAAYMPRRRDTRGRAAGSERPALCEIAHLRDLVAELHDEAAG